MPPTMTIEDGAKNLVERSRKGDQNATAMLVKIKQNAKAGNERAKKAYAACAAYIKRNPFGAEEQSKEIIVMGTPISQRTKITAVAGATIIGGIAFGLPGAAVLGISTYLYPQIRNYFKG